MIDRGIMIFYSQLFGFFFYSQFLELDLGMFLQLRISIRFQLYYNIYYYFSGDKI